MRTTGSIGAFFFSWLTYLNNQLSALQVFQYVHELSDLTIQNEPYRHYVKRAKKNGSCRLFLHFVVIRTIILAALIEIKSENCVNETIISAIHETPSAGVLLFLHQSGNFCIYKTSV